MQFYKIIVKIYGINIMMMKQGSILLLGLVLMASCSKDTNYDALTYENADIPVQQQLMGVFEGEWIYEDYAPAKGTIKVDGSQIQMDFPCEMVFGNILDRIQKYDFLNPEEKNMLVWADKTYSDSDPEQTIAYSDPEQTIAYRMSGASSEAIYASATLVENHFTDVKTQLDFSFGVIADDGHKYQIALINSTNEINAVFDLTTRLWTLVYRFKTVRITDLENGMTIDITTEQLVPDGKDRDSQTIVFKAKERKDMSGIKSFQ